ncbi:MAG: hypothetical protein ACRDY7_02140 [Acidimicrobiia bacterium]
MVLVGVEFLAFAEGESGDHPPASMTAVENLDGRFDTVVYCLADDTHHAATLAALHRRPGVVVAHDVRLPTLHREAAHAGRLAGGLGDALRRAYGDAIPPGLGHDGTLDPDDAARRGVLMIRAVAAAATRLFVPTAEAAALARLDAAPGDRPKIAVLSPDPDEAADQILTRPPSPTG